MEVGAQRRQHYDLVRAGARKMPTASVPQPQAIVATLRHHGCGSSQRSLSLYGRALPVLGTSHTVPSESDVFGDRPSASARRCARGRGVVLSSRVASLRMFASVRSGAAASAIRSMHSSEALRPDLTPELRGVGAAFRKTLLEIRAECIDVV